MPPHKDSALRASALVVVVALATLIAGCRTEVPRPVTVYELSASGVVESVEEIEGGRRVWFAGGESIELDYGAVSLGSDPVPAGYLLLVGSNGSTTAYVTLWDHEECWVLNEPAVDDGTHLVFDFGLRLPKASGFDPGPNDTARFPSFREGFCINPAGEVVRYGA